MKTKKRTTQELINKFFKNGTEGVELFNRFYLKRPIDFVNADFRNADFVDADFRNADFVDANFVNADFRNADFVDANFRNADFRNADFRNADFWNADFSGANLNFLINECTSFLELSCPGEGSFIAYKKANGYMVKLEILKDALRSSATSHKCRCSKAKVLAIENIDKSPCDLTEVLSDYDKTFIYKVGKIVKVDNFDTNRWHECSTGIHFFLSRKMAECYN